MNIPITKPYFGPEELDALKEPLATGWVTQGPHVRRFEERFAQSIGADHAVSCTSCTAALHLSLAALGVGPGDEVIVPAFTFIASANAVEYVGARPVFVDVDLDTFNMSVEGIERAITPRTRAIMPVHLFGLAADMDPILAIARSRGIFVVEDAACGVGSRYRGQAAGTLGDAGCFSFHPRKVITTGEGGMVVARDAEVARRTAVLRSHGATVSDLERHQGKGFTLPCYDLLGFNYRMTDLQAAIGIVQLGRLDWLVAERRRAARRYSDALAGLSGVTIPVEPEGYFHVYQSFVLFVAEDAAMSRDGLAVELANEGIATRQGTHAVHTLGFYASKYGLRPEDCPNAFAADRQTLALPLYPQMTAEEQEYVIDRIVTIMGRK